MKRWRAESGANRVFKKIVTVVSMWLGKKVKGENTTYSAGVSFDREDEQRIQKAERETFDVSRALAELDVRLTREVDERNAHHH